MASCLYDQEPVLHPPKVLLFHDLFLTMMAPYTISEYAER